MNPSKPTRATKFPMLACMGIFEGNEFQNNMKYATEITVPTHPVVSHHATPVHTPHAEAMKAMNGITHMKLSILISPWFKPIDLSKDDLTDIPHRSRKVMRPIT